MLVGSLVCDGRTCPDSARGSTLERHPSSKVLSHWFLIQICLSPTLAKYPSLGVWQVHRERREGGRGSLYEFDF